MSSKVIDYSSNFVGDTYTIDPNTLKYDKKIAEFNQSKPIEEYNSLKKGIRDNGQNIPIYIRDNLCGDGRNRAKACIELGISVMAIDISPTVSDSKYIQMCNENTFTARNDSATQITIKAFKLANVFGYTDAEARKIVGLKDKRAIGFARYISSSSFAWVLDELLEGRAVSIGSENPTKSLETAKKRISKIEEEESNVIEISNDTEKIDYVEMVNTERGKDLFYEYADIISNGSKHDKMMFVVKHLNTMLKLKTDENTGEIKEGDNNDMDRS